MFWAVKHYLAAADERRLSNERALEGLVSHVAGIDLHPVAVALARVTYVLAIGAERLRSERPPFSVPIYLGDSVRWEQDETLLAKGGITIHTTDGAELFDRELHFPAPVVADASRFDQLVAELAHRASARPPGSPVPTIDPVLNRSSIRPEDRASVEAAFKALCDLHDQGRDHIWGYYVRNLARPLAFAQPENRVDVLVGNPPWLAYRFMPKSMQERYRKLSEERRMWAGGKVSTHQDLSDLFVVRCVEQFLASSGRFAFVMPAAALTRSQYKGFRKGYYYPAASGGAVAARFSESWDLRRVSPDIFPVPACVVFGERAAKESALPRETTAYAGRIAPRGTRWRDAEASLSAEPAVIGRSSAQASSSPYSERFFQGATILPRVLLTVCRLPSGPLGTPVGTQRIASLRSSLEKLPWKGIDSLEGIVEEQFIRRAYLGVSISPFRPLEPVEAVIPWGKHRLLDRDDPELYEYPNLAEWWEEAEKIWEQHKGPKNSLSLSERLDYHRELSNQFPLQANRVVYTKSGNRITACRLEDKEAVIDHKLYWAAVSSPDEGRYLTSIFNSDTLHAKVEPLMSEGLFGKRDVDKYVFAVPFPTFDPDTTLHMELAQAGSRAEQVAHGVDLSDDPGFQRARRRVREAVVSDGVASTIDELVEGLLAPSLVVS